MMQFAKWTNSSQVSITRDILKMTEQPGVISFAGGVPAPELFPAAELAHAYREVLAAEPQSSLQYTTTEGFHPLREALASLMVERGVQCSADDIALVHGSQQALDLVGRLFLEPGDLVLVEETTYHGAVLAFNPHGVRYRAVPTDDHGLKVEALRDLLQEERPKLIYSMPTFHNPSGVSLSHQRRQALAALVAEFEVPLIEDDAYAELRYDGKQEPAVKAFDQDGRVIYMSTFSKILAPGLRLGWVVAPREVIAKLNIAQMGASFHVGTLLQRVVHFYLSSGGLPSHIETLRSAYRVRRDAMFEALTAHMSEVARWTRPEGGFFIWVQLADGLSTRQLLQAALSEKVAFVPGDPFFAAGGGQDNTLRLSFSTATVESIKEGFARLARAVRVVA